MCQSFLKDKIDLNERSHLSVRLMLRISAMKTFCHRVMRRLDVCLAELLCYVRKIDGLQTLVILRLR
jgi:hypothetical protein